MILPAISIGYAVPRADFDAAVHSIFREAVNLRLIPDDTLVTVVASAEADLPQGIRVDSPRGFSFEAYDAGLQVSCRDETVHLGSLSVDLRGARRWKCDLPALQADLRRPAVSAAWRFVWKELSRRQGEANADIIAADLLRPDQNPRSAVAKRAGEAMGGLMAATRRHDLSGASTSARALIGLGQGLTPSGDDILAGYMAGLWCGLGEESGRHEFISGLGRTLVESSIGTTYVSRAYLSHATHGQVSSRLADLAEAICKGVDSDPLTERAVAAMKVGHTSGMDAVTGLLLGLAAWDQGSLETAGVLRAAP